MTKMKFANKITYQNKTSKIGHSDERSVSRAEQNGKTGIHHDSPTKEHRFSRIRDNSSQAPIDSTVQMIIHEIRNPLSAISLANQSLKQEPVLEKEKLQAFTDVISKNTARIEDLLKEFVNMKTYCKEEFELADICDILERSLKKAEDRIFLKNVRVIKTYGFDLHLYADIPKLTTAFLNIIINAVEAVNDKGKLWITVYRAKNELKVIFKDNGSGMDPATMQHMFDKKFSTKPNGLGVGMAYVKEILDRHHATVNVDSEPGKGTALFITFKT